MNDSVNRIRNMHSLRAEFFVNGKPSEGYKHLHTMVKKNEFNKIDYLLRYHKPNGVYGYELQIRFHIDALIEYYNLLLVGVMAGYIPPELDAPERDDILMLLGNRAVQPYYMERYSYPMTALTLKYVQKQEWTKVEATDVSITVFNELIMLNRQLRTDKDIIRFTGMLDFVVYKSVSLKDVLKVLSSEKRLSAVLSSKKTNRPLHSAVWGFMKYTAFMSQMRQVLEETRGQPLLQSAVWLYHGYYFEQMNNQMSAFFEIAFDCLGKALVELNSVEQLAEEIFGEEVPEEFDGKQLKEMAAKIVTQARTDFEYVLNRDFGKALYRHIERGESLSR
jgi:hypothetical protein